MHIATTSLGTAQFHSKQKTPKTQQQAAPPSKSFHNETITLFITFLRRTV